MPKADNFVGHIQQIQTKLESILQESKDRQAQYYNNNKRIDAVYQPGDLVWLSRKFIKTRRPSQKLDYRRIGPFRVVCMVGKNAVRLALSPEYARVHPVFNVSLVMPVIRDDIEIGGELLYETQPLTREEFSIAIWLSVDVILDHRVSEGQHKYLLQTESMGINNTWVSMGHISRGLDEFIQAFHEIHPNHVRPSWNLFEDLSRPDVGYLADA